ncbi:SAM-dependent methyltransferase [Streptomyces griseochromogenes]|uniref:Methyltransferase n=1 Tax=Streptomyces griseochromogenes TaxID=68214 RepID=A0A1B1AY67_9ACTN|nr:class I SAM-dependent methyltransferase [Streptomyces griseochromogenes]ANP51487.1 methyltransferase [Streptomyces griseochromogenes]MBP2049749.1 SAM-dependent methyltransferase [Streptomyces griseochromogenes]
MIEGWEWDETLFEGTAAHYARSRLPYAPGLVPKLADVLGPDGTGRLIDVGCGPGTLTLPLSRLFDEVVGVDPDPGMLEEAARRAAATGAGKTRWVGIRAEDLPADLGTFTAAVFAQSFHWTDRDLVAATVYDMLRPGGALVHVSDLKGERLDTEGLSCPVAPYPAIRELIRKYLGPVRRAGRGVLVNGTPGGEAAVFLRAGFLGPERYVVPGGQALERGEDDVVAWVFSMSSSAPGLFGPRLAAFEADLRGLLRAASPTGRFSERGPSTEVFVWRKPSASIPADLPDRL